VESYIVSHADVRFSHSVCPDCSERVRKEIATHAAEKASQARSKDK